MHHDLQAIEITNWQPRDGLSALILNWHKIARGRPANAGLTTVGDTSYVGRTSCLYARSSGDSSRPPLRARMARCRSAASSALCAVSSKCPDGLSSGFEYLHRDKKKSHHIPRSKLRAPRHCNRMPFCRIQSSDI